MDGCTLTRPTDEWLLQSGDWESVDIRAPANEGPWDTIPHAYGKLVKSKG